MSEPRQSFDPATHHLWKKAKVGREVYISDMVRVRGRPSMITLGDEARLQDMVVVQADAPVTLGYRAQVDFGAVLKASAPVTICAKAKIGPNATILAGAINEAGEWETGPVEIGTGAIVGAGAVVLPGSIVPAGAIIRPNEVFPRAPDAIDRAETVSASAL